MKKLGLVFVALLLFAGAAWAQNEIQLKTKIEYSFQSSVYVPTGNNDLTSGSPTLVAFTCDEGGTGLADQTAINSPQIDLGVIRPTEFHVISALEWFAVVVAGVTVDFYWSASANTAVAAGNPGLPDGACTNIPATADCLYAPTNFTDDEGVQQMTLIGSHINNGSSSDVQISYIGSFTATHQYGQLVMFNNSGTILCGTDDIESSVLMYGTVLEIQP